MTDVIEKQCVSFYPFPRINDKDIVMTSADKKRVERRNGPSERRESGNDRREDNRVVEEDPRRKGPDRRLNQG